MLGHRLCVNGIHPQSFAGTPVSRALALGRKCRISTLLSILSSFCSLVIVTFFFFFFLSANLQVVVRTQHLSSKTCKSEVKEDMEQLLRCVARYRDKIVAKSDRFIVALILLEAEL